LRVELFESSKRKFQKRSIIEVPLIFKHVELERRLLKKRGEKNTPTKEGKDGKKIPHDCSKKETE